MHTAKEALRENRQLYTFILKKGWKVMLSVKLKKLENQKMTPSEKSKKVYWETWVTGNMWIRIRNLWIRRLNIIGIYIYSISATAVKTPAGF